MLDNTNTEINYDDEDVVAALLAKDADEPSEAEDEGNEPEAEEVESEDEETPSDDEAEEDSEADEDDGSDEGNEVTLGDDTKIKRKINGQEVEVSLGELVKNYGLNEAASAKVQEVTNLRKNLDTAAETVVGIADTLLTRAKERYAQYEQVDWVDALHTLSSEDYKALYAAAQTAYNDVAVFEQNLTGVMQKQREIVNQHQAFELKERAKKTLSFLKSEASPIPGFDEKMYNSMIADARTRGVPDEIINQSVDPWAIQLFHDAMMYRKTKDVSSKSEVVKKTPTKIVKSKSNSKSTSTSNPDKALKRLKESGSEDDALAFLLSRS